MNGFDGDIRDMLGCASHVEVCGDMRDMRDGPPPRNRAVGSAVFWDRPPQSTKGGKKERQTTSQPKRNAYFPFKLLIINDINQYFNIHLHLISFIIYNL